LGGQKKGRGLAKEKAMENKKLFGERKNRRASCSSKKKMTNLDLDEKRESL